MKRILTIMTIVMILVLFPVYDYAEKSPFAVFGFRPQGT
jgi:hypothetical protein